MTSDDKRAAQKAIRTARQEILQGRPGPDPGVYQLEFPHKSYKTISYVPRGSAGFAIPAARPEDGKRKEVENSQPVEEEYVQASMFGEGEFNYV